MWKQCFISKKVIVVVSILCVLGAFVAVYLSWLHYQVFTNPSYKSFCAMSDAFNCETVAESPYSVFLGMPVAVWGFIGYFVMFLIASIGVLKHKLASAYIALFSVSTFSMIVSVVLAIISYCIICSFCIMCSVTYVINGAIFLTLLLHARKTGFSFKESLADLLIFLRLRIIFIIALIPAVYMLCVVFPKYWIDGGRATNGLIASGVTQDGHAWIGAKEPKLEIVEFSDYFCPYCKRSHSSMRKLVAMNPKKLRLIHRHFPLDSACNPLLTKPFHEGACIVSRAAICAKRQGKFWEANDMLYSAGKLIGKDWSDKLQDVAKLSDLELEEFKNCLSSREAEKELKVDIDEALSLGLTGTPSFIVNGKVYVGSIDKELLEQYGIVTSDNKVNEK